jgi:hypothetical protein
VAENCCLFCDKPAGSKEHVFPAAFGGRREEKGIYCRDHNEKFGAHVTALLKELDIVNAQLGIRSDRRDDVRPAPVVGPDGETYTIAQGRIEVRLPNNIDENYEAFGAERSQRFPSQAAASRWINLQHKRGYKVKGKASGAPAVELNFEPFHVQRNLGEPPFMRALLYFGVTYLAHHFPDLARSEGVAAARSELLRSGDLLVPVNWQPPQVLDQLLPNPFRLGHTVVVAIDSNTHRVDALISLWGTMHVGMELGTADTASTIRATTFIDPFADCPPDDIQEHREAGVNLVLAPDADGIAYLHNVASGEVQHPWEPILAHAAAQQRTATVSELFDALNAARSLRPSARDDAIVMAVAAHRQRILNLIVHAVEQIPSSGESEPLEKIASVLLMKEKEAVDGLAPQTRAMLTLVQNAIARQLRAHVLKGTLTREVIDDLIVGASGQRLAHETVALALAGVHKALQRG